MRLSTVFYHINYCHPSFHITFRVTYETSKSTVRYMLKVIVRDTTKSLLKQLWARPLHSLINWDTVFSTRCTSSYPKSHERKRWKVSPFKFHETIRLIVKTLTIQAFQSLINQNWRRLFQNSSFRYTRILLSNSIYFSEFI